MKSGLKLSAALLPSVIALALVTGPARADLVTDWNVTANELMTAENTGNNPRLRTLSMMHVAISDAVNTVTPRYTRVVATMPTVSSASPEAAATAAARHVLTQLYPKQKDKIEATYAASLKMIPEGLARAEGIALGEQVAMAVIADRATDGTNAPDTYRPHTTAGVYVPTAPPLFEQYARARPWLIPRPDYFRPGPPPALSSAEYAKDYNEVKEIGGTKSATRTADQTDAVTFWRNANFGQAWQRMARELASAKELPLPECARLFALLNMSLANAYIISWDAKYTYQFWRPITAIRNADIDGNDATERDAGWTPLNQTPMHPEYPSQAAINSTIASLVLASVFGSLTEVPFQIPDIADAKRTRSFKTVADMVEEQKNVRVWGGVHFRVGLEVGADLGRKVVAYMLENSLKPTQ